VDVREVEHSGSGPRDSEPAYDTAGSGSYEGSGQASRACYSAIQLSAPERVDGPSRPRGRGSKL